MYRVIILFLSVVVVDVRGDKSMNEYIFNLAKKSYGGSEMAPYIEDPAYEDKPYDKRFYPSMKWVSTRYQCSYASRCSTMGFWKLFNYISGENSQDAKINMTVPVLTAIDLRRRSSRMQEMSFYIPSKFQENTPKPKREDVYVKSMTNMMVYVIRYNGWSTSEKVMEMYQTLKSMLEKDNISFYNEMIITAGYEGPGQLFNRRNEVWLISDEK